MFTAVVAIRHKDASLNPSCDPEPSDKTPEESQKRSANAQRMVVLGPTNQCHNILDPVPGFIVSLEERQSLYSWIEDRDDDIHLNTSSRHEDDHDRG